MITRDFGCKIYTEKGKTPAQRFKTSTRAEVLGQLLYTPGLLRHILEALTDYVKAWNVRTNVYSERPANPAPLTHQSRKSINRGRGALPNENPK